MKLRLKDYLVGVTLEEIERETNIPIGTLKRIAYGDSNPTLATIKPICDYLAIKVDDLIDNRKMGTNTDLLGDYEMLSDNDKATIQMLIRTKAVKSHNEVKADKHKINVMIPTTKQNDGVNISTCIIEEHETTVKSAYIGYKIVNNNFLDYLIAKNDIILLEYRNAQDGEIGVFNNGSQAYLRLLEERGNQYILHPINRVGEDIIIDDIHAWTCVGVYVGKL